MNRSTRHLALLGGGAGLGAGLMYLLDPQGGGRRRALARDKAVHAYHLSSETLREKLAKVKEAHSLDDQLVLHESVEGVPALQNGSSGRRGLNLPPAARLLAGTAGGVLALAGLARMVRSTGAVTAFARR